MFQSVWGEKRKDEATTQAIICTILSASDTYAVDISLERRRTEEREDVDDLEEVFGRGEKKNLGWRRRQETLLYGV